ncbi:MAG: chitosanase [Bdellovibrionales bacterium]|nr:chitosanase [Bdellovibrionales bacterium]
MKHLFTISAVLLMFSINSFAFTDPKVGGVVTLKKGLEKKINKTGVLYIFAKQAGPDSGPNDRTPPVAVIRVESPTFPQAFVITQKNVMIPGAAFKGPLHVIARYSPSGDALNKSGAIEGLDPKFPSADLGNKNLNIELNVELK